MNNFHITSIYDYITEDNKFDPFKAITYIIVLDIVFSGFEPCKLKFKLIVPHYETVTDVYIEKCISERLKVFDNIFRYQIIEYTEAVCDDRIYPMM